jgi:hypothetical protein
MFWLNCALKGEVRYKLLGRPLLAIKNAVSTLQAILAFSDGRPIARSHQAMTNKQLYDFVVNSLKKGS